MSVGRVARRLPARVDGGGGGKVDRHVPGGQRDVAAWPGPPRTPTRLAGHAGRPPSGRLPRLTLRPTRRLTWLTRGRLACRWRLTRRRLRRSVCSEEDERRTKEREDRAARGRPNGGSRCGAVLAVHCDTSRPRIFEA